MQVHGASRPYPGETENGDKWLWLALGSALRVAVIDGAGHGREAAKASQRAVEVITQLASKSLAETLIHCHAALKGTRGAVLSLVHVDDGKLEFLGVGNVQGRLILGNESKQLAPDRGLLGAALPQLHPQSFEVTSEWALLLCSDGINERSIRDFRAEDCKEPQKLTDEMVRTGGRLTDDATAVLITP